MTGSAFGGLYSYGGQTTPRGEITNELTLAELKVLSITLDKEHMNAKRRNQKLTMNRFQSTDPHVLN